MAPSADISSEELDQIYQFALGLSKQVGDMLLRGVEERCEGDKEKWQAQEEKLNAVDIVTQMDTDLETYIETEIRRAYPAHKIISEESYSKGGLKTYMIDDDPTWCIDPLDGTVNYTHLFPQFCISIAFIHHSRPLIGVITAPLLYTTYAACHGRGAWLHLHQPFPSSRDAPLAPQRLPLRRNPIPVLPADAPKGCIFAFEWGKDRRHGADGTLAKKVESFVAMATEVAGEVKGGRGGMVHGMRSLGSATLDLAYTATGAFDIWWEGGCWEWDVAAGICILVEAGGLVTTANPPTDPSRDAIEEVSLGGRLFLAIRPAGSTSDESGREAQERVVREVWKRVQCLGYTRPGT